MKNTSIACVSLLGGMLVGSILTMLFTPYSGPELRKQIKDYIDGEKEKAEKKLADLEERISETACHCNDR